MAAKNKEDEITANSLSNSSTSSSADDEGKPESLQPNANSVLGAAPRVYHAKTKGNKSPLSFDCPFCKSTFKAKDDMLHHMNEHIDKKNNENTQAWKDHSSKLKYSLRVRPTPVQTVMASQIETPSNTHQRAAPVKIAPKSPTNQLKAQVLLKSDSETDVAQALASNSAVNEQLKEKCNVCLKMFLTKEALTDHLIEHALDCHTTQFPKCEKSVPSSLADNRKSQLANAEPHSDAAIVTARHPNHESSAKISKIHTCPTCYKVFPNQHKMAEHAVGHVIQNYPCNRCSRSFRSKAELINHMSQHPRPRPTDSFKCRNCGKFCFNFTTLKAHIRFCVHPYVKVCSVCHAVLENSAQFKMHIIDHVRTGRLDKFTDAYITYCCSHCDWDFWCRDELRGHQMIRAANVSFKCSLCNAKFCIISHLDKHMAWHNKIQPYKCKYCPTQWFETKSLLDEHLSEDHDPLRPYNCPHCEKCFFLPSTLQLHIKDHFKSNQVGSQPSVCRKSLKISKPSATSSGSDNRQQACGNATNAEGTEPDLLKLVQETIQIAESNTASGPSALPPELDFLAQALDCSDKSTDAGLGLIPRRVPVSLKPTKSIIRIQIPCVNSKSVPVATPAVTPNTTRLIQHQPKVSQTEEVILPDPVSPAVSRSPSPPTIRPPFLTRTYSKAAALNRTYSKTQTPPTEWHKTMSALAVANDNVTVNINTNHPNSNLNEKHALSKPSRPTVKVSRPSLVESVNTEAAKPTSELPTPLAEQVVSDGVAALESKFGALFFMAVGQETARRLEYFEVNVTALIQHILATAGIFPSTVNSPVSHGTLSLDIYSIMKLFVSEDHIDDPLFTPCSIDVLLAEMLWVMMQNPELSTA